MVAEVVRGIPFRTVKCCAIVNIMSDSSIHIPSPYAERQVIAAIARATGEEPVSAVALAGGMISDVRKVTFADGRVLVSKYMTGPDAHFDIEARMLATLHHSGVVPVPAVCFATRELLLQEFMPGTHMTPAAEADLGDTLARLHGCRSEAFGFDGQTLNGTFVLPNGWRDAWIPFYRDLRLGYAADAAVKNGTLQPVFRTRIQRLQERLDDLLDEPAHAALVHGDIWRANVLAIGDRVTALLDPSAHYGHPEMDIANAIELGGMGEAFVRAYTRHHPLDPGFWATRRYVYAVFPAIMHVYYFGARYEPLLDRMLTGAGC